MQYIARWIDDDGEEYDRATVEVGPGWAKVDGKTVPVEATPDRDGACLAAAVAMGDGCPGHHEDDIVIEEADA